MMEFHIGTIFFPLLGIAGDNVGAGFIPALTPQV